MQLKEYYVQVVTDSILSLHHNQGTITCKLQETCGAVAFVPAFVAPLFAYVRINFDVEQEHKKVRRSL